MKLETNALDIFYQICAIPHASGDTSALKNFIITFCKNANCNIKIDKANNIHAIKGKPKICLQAHYDMVLIGKKIKPFIENNFLKARDSSLGADNGAGLSAILALASIKKDFEAIFTNDEEIGMIGARNLDLKIESKKILNVDSECLNEICVGCAGGFDADIWLKSKKNAIKNYHFYKITTQNFGGGHSGIDIDKNIPNAILELVWAIKKLNARVIKIKGGEKRNSIPSVASAIVAVKMPILKTIPNMKIKQINKIYKKAYKKDFVNAILSIHNGVLAKENKAVIASLNLSIINNKKLSLMARANRIEHLWRLQQILKLHNATISGLYEPWERQESPFLDEIKNAYKKLNIPHSLIEIHAGLECGILKQKCGINEVYSIGPTIANPHSKGESLDIASFKSFCDILKTLIKESI